MPAPPSRLPARDRLLNAAAALFYDHGIAGTGIDAVVARAGVAKKSLYNNFASKADLVAQYLDARHAEWLALHAARAADATTSHARVLAVFDAYQDHAESAYDHGFRGCGLLNAAAELPADHPGRDTVRRHKEQVEALIEDALRDLIPADRASALARQLSFLLEGAITRAGLERDSRCVQQARDMADALMDAAV